MALLDDINELVLPDAQLPENKDDPMFSFDFYNPHDSASLLSPFEDSEVSSASSPSNHSIDGSNHSNEGGASLSPLWSWTNTNGFIDPHSLQLDGTLPDLDLDLPDLDSLMMGAPLDMKAESDNEDPLAKQVRDAAGVLLAVPSEPHTSSTPAQVEPQSQALPPPSIVVDDTSLPKLPIPRLPRLEQSAGKTKTSHTTIERRYRTNLNSGLQSLRRAVPALRVLTPEEGDTDTIDDRGFADGVKVARKASKASILNKAVEYIRVLKKREARLTKERDGVRGLIRSLVGGQALLREWDAAWKAQHGGPETDEVEHEKAPGADDDDDDDQDDAGDEGEERIRKKPKMEMVKKPAVKKAPPPPPEPILNPDGTITIPEKRKRGRPRKNPLPLSIPTSLPMNIPTSTPIIAGQGPVLTMNPADPNAQPVLQLAPEGIQPGRYLLAAFVFFGLFNTAPTFKSQPSPAAHPHTHEGSVLGSTSQYLTHESKWDATQAIHLLASLLIIFSILAPYVSTVFPSSPFSKSRQSSISRNTQLESALETDNKDALSHVLPFFSWNLSDGLEKKGMIRLAELSALRAMPLWKRIGVFFSLYRHHSSLSARDLGTLALLSPLKGHSEQLWAVAKRKTTTSVEKIVLNSISVVEAQQALSTASLPTTTSEIGPMELLAIQLVTDTLKLHAQQTLEREILSSKDCTDEKVSRDVIAAGLMLPPIRRIVRAFAHVSGMSSVFKVKDEDDEYDPSHGEQVMPLLSALVLYRRMFPSSDPTNHAAPISPPTSAYSWGTSDEESETAQDVTDDATATLERSSSNTAKSEARDGLALRQVLAHSVFEEGSDALEDARDRVIDLLDERRRVRSARVGGRRY